MFRSTTLGGSTWGLEVRTQTNNRYDLSLYSCDYPRDVAVSLLLDRADLLQIARWYESLDYNLAPRDPWWRLLNAAIEAGSDPALTWLTQEAAYAISTLVREALDEVRAEREEESCSRST